MATRHCDSQRIFSTTLWELDATRREVLGILHLIEMKYFCLYESPLDSATVMSGPDMNSLITKLDVWISHILHHFINLSSSWMNLWLNPSIKLLESSSSLREQRICPCWYNIVCWENDEEDRSKYSLITCSTIPRLVNALWWRTRCHLTHSFRSRISWHTIDSLARYDASSSMVVF